MQKHQEVQPRAEQGHAFRDRTVAITLGVACVVSAFAAPRQDATNLRNTGEYTTREADPLSLPEYKLLEFMAKQEALDELNQLAAHPGVEEYNRPAEALLQTNGQPVTSRLDSLYTYTEQPTPNGPETTISNNMEVYVGLIEDGPDKVSVAVVKPDGLRQDGSPDAWFEKYQFMGNFDASALTAEFSPELVEDLLKRPDTTLEGVLVGYMYEGTSTSMRFVEMADNRTGVVTRQSEDGQFGVYQAPPVAPGEGRIGYPQFFDAVRE